MFKKLFSKKEEVRPPNILLIIADDLGFGDVGCYGAAGIQTPNIDLLAEEGVRFTSYYSGGVTCTGGRAALLTGCYPHRVGLGGKNIPPGAFKGLNPEERTLPKVLGEAGYLSGYIGKWALGSHPQFMPMNQGFDYFFGVPYSHSYLDSDVEDHIFLTSNLPLMDCETELEEDTDPQELTPRLAEQTAEFIESAGDHPFCLVFSSLIPHRPLLPMENFQGSSKRGIYGDAVQEFDWSVGALIEVLKHLDKYDDTMIIVTSDNGPAHISEQAAGYIGGTGRPYRGAKGQTLEGGIRVPCVVRLPERIPAGQVCKEMVTAMDWLPTIAGVVGTEIDRKKPELDGVDVWPLINGEKYEKVPRDEFWYYKESRLQALRKGQWKLLMYRSNWDLERPEKSDYRLFNLDADRLEESNVADQHPEVVDELAKLADKARRELGDIVHNKKGRGVRAAGEAATA
jgi:arylsulfatase A